MREKCRQINKRTKEDCRVVLSFLMTFHNDVNDEYYDEGFDDTDHNDDYDDRLLR